MKILVLLLFLVGPIAKGGEGFIVSQDLSDPEVILDHHPDNLALACFYNVTDRDIRILWRYGYGYWNEYLVPKDRNKVSLLYYRSYNNYWPPLTIRFDASTSGYPHWVDRSISQYLVPQLDCSKYGKRYIFNWNRTDPAYVDHFRCRDNVCNLED